MDTTEINQEELVIGGDEAMEVFIHGVDGSNPTLAPQVTVKDMRPPIEDDRLQIHEDRIDPKEPVAEAVPTKEVGEERAGTESASTGSPAKVIGIEIHDGLSTEEPAAPKGVDADDE